MELVGFYFIKSRQFPANSSKLIQFTELPVSLKHIVYHSLFILRYSRYLILSDRLTKLLSEFYGYSANDTWLISSVFLDLIVL
jgi:hypothetical protein